MRTLRNGRRAALLVALAAGVGLLGGPAQAQTAPALRLPGAGTVAGVVETRLRDGFDQRIRYAGGDGRNHAEIALRNETGDLLLAFPPRLSKPSQFGIEGEIAVRFPGQAMRVLTSPRRNAYGPVGIALSADCLYAWQWFERPAAGTRVAAGGLFGPLPQSASGRRALSLRIRLCRTAEASLDTLVAAVEGLTIVLPEGGFAAPAARPARRAPPRPPAPTQAAARPQPEAPPKPKPPEAPPQAAITSPRQPAPPVAPPPEPRPGDAGRRYLAPTLPPAAPEAPAPAPAEAPPPRPGGPQRYITDGPRPAEVPSPAQGRAPAGESLSRDLPAEAYRPPAAPR